MPVYSFAETVPKDTQFKDAISKTLKLCPGVWTDAIIRFHAGAMSLARFQVLDGLLNVIPGREDEYYSGEDATEQIPVWHELTKEPFELTWKLWNVDDTNEHEILLKVVVLPQEIASNLKAISSLTDEVRKLQKILTGEVPGPLINLQLDLAKFIKLLPVEQTTPTPSPAQSKKTGAK
jgi:hypothetical protein